MRIYIDTEFKCHTTNPDGNYREVENEFFNGKCSAFIEGYRFIPDGESWVRQDGVVFSGEMVSPFRSYTELMNAQKIYEDLINMSAQDDTDAMLVDHEYRLTMLELGLTE